MSIMVINVGYNNFIVTNRILTVVSVSSNSMVRLRQNTEDRGKYINCAQGKKVKTLIIMKSGHVVGSHLDVDKINKRLQEIQEQS